MDTTDILCNKEVYNVNSAGKIVGDICTCVLDKDHEGVCLCKHTYYKRYQSHMVDSIVYGLDAYSKFKKGQQ